ncbi:MAG: PD40 domain-containing protein [Bacteroidales bacterium]|nr:PD40 domain-containing protein [Bacteroidales bacterium]MBN2758509.1 PD40 domain-containing protein [Bacteroidales bacterium]
MKGQKFNFTTISFSILFFINLFILIPISLKSQEQNDLFYIADDYIDNENFTGAINLYQRMLDEDPNNAQINFKLGFCYLNTAHEKEKAIDYIEKSVQILSKKKKKSSQFLETSYYLAKAYQSNYRFDEAISQYEKLTEQTKNKKLLLIINNEITKCIEGKNLTSQAKKIEIENIGDSINSEFSDHSPIINGDESILIFTSRRETDIGDEMESDGEYSENIFVSYGKEEGWTYPISIGKNINTSEHEASIGLSVDGQQLYIYKSEDEGSIYVSELNGEEWSVPMKLGPTINTKYRETHASLSADGNKLYFTSDRKGGYGGLDIYVAHKLISGEWSEAKNLGPSINTESDERAPYIHPDGVTLYFSSKGHGGLGGFDIFKSSLNEFGTWTIPENIGFPINTTSDDVFFVPSADGQKAYYTSNKNEGYGKSDIFVIKFKEAEKTKITIMTGKIFVCRGNLPEVSITVMDASNDEVIGIYTPNSKSGKFLFVLNKDGKYNVLFESNGKLILSEKLYVPKEAAYQQLYKVIEIPVDPPCADNELQLMEEQEFAGGINIDNIDENGIVYDENIKIENILFPFNNADEVPDSKSLKALAKYLKENQNTVIEIGAYADSKGKAIYNQALSLKRGNVVKLYLMRKGAKEEQMIVVGYGEENPIAINLNPDGTWNTEAQKFNRRIEFRVNKQGNSSLLVKPIQNIPLDFRNKNYRNNYKKSESNTTETKI